MVIDVPRDVMARVARWWHVEEEKVGQAPSRSSKLDSEN